LAVSEFGGVLYDWQWVLQLCLLSFLQCPASEQDCMNVDSHFPPFSSDELFLLKQQEKIKEVVGRPKSAHIGGRSRCTTRWCKQAEQEIRGQQDVYSETGALVMDYVEEDRSRPKRR